MEWPHLVVCEDTDNEHWEILINIQRFKRASDYVIALRDAFMELFAKILSSIMIVSDEETFFERIGSSEDGFDRALLFSDMVTTATNVFTKDSDETLSEYLSGEEAVEDTVSVGFKAKLYDLVRATNPSKKKVIEELKFGKGKPPADLFDFSRLSHRQRRVISPINVRNWDKANWIGVAVGIIPSIAPFLGLIFKNENAAKSIFKDWRDSLGMEDVNDCIRVAIVRGLSTNDPYGYGVVIGGNVETATMQQGDTVISISRIKHMEHPNPKNLETFLQEYRIFGRFLLGPAVSANRFENVHFLDECGIGKWHLHVKDAWQIGNNDPDGVIIRSDHDPIIPPDVDNAPVKGLIARKRAIASSDAINASCPSKTRKKKNKKMWRR